MELSAEAVYLFRHAVVRDAAYHLQPPSERAVLHALALDVITALPGLNEKLFALELAQHAEIAQVHDKRFAALERKYLKLGGDHARFNYDYPNALRALTRLHGLLAADPAERAMVADSLADLHERMGQWQEALGYFEEVRANAEDREYAGRALVHLAWIGLETGAEVDACLREGEEIAEDKDSDQLRIAFMMCRAKQHSAGGDPAQAAREMGRVIEFARRTKDWIQEMVGHSNAADYAAQAGALEAARTHNEAAEKFARNPRTKHFLIGILVTRATLAIRRREFNDAVRFAEEAVQLGVETRSRGLVGSSLNARAIALTGQGKYVDAFDTFEKVRPIIAETGDAVLAVRWLSARSELMRLWNKPEQALNELEDAVIELGGRVPEGSIHGVRLEIALCRAALGREEDALNVLNTLHAESPSLPISVYRAGLLCTQGKDVQAVSELRAWLEHEPVPGVHAEPLEFLARAWLAIANVRGGDDAGTPARDALRVAQRLKLAEHPSPGLGELIERCVHLADECPDSPDSIDEG